MLRPASAFSGESGSCLAPRVATRGNTPPDPLTAGLRPAYAVAPLPLSRFDRGGGGLRAAECRTLPMWKHLDDLINDYLDTVSLQDLMQPPKFVTVDGAEE